ncbi:MAG TPA: DUF192 domain-containing protein [Longimicrobiales bacterium]|nr:DUF192 domain-containing protein [Longimicrobiales bacterium]
MKRAIPAAVVLLALLAGTAEACHRGGAAIHTTKSTALNGATLELPDRAGPVRFDSGSAYIIQGGDTFHVRIEIASNEQQRERGLMFRTAMPDTSGMLFIYPTPQQGSFWMLDTPLPLSIAFADSAGVIFHIVDMEPCVQEMSWECPTYDSGGEFQYALEMKKGYFKERGVTSGAKLSWSGK